MFTPDGTQISTSMHHIMKLMHGGAVLRVEKQKVLLENGTRHTPVNKNTFNGLLERGMIKRAGSLNIYTLAIKAKQLFDGRRSRYNPVFTSKPLQRA